MDEMQNSSGAALERGGNYRPAIGALIFSSIMSTGFLGARWWWSGQLLFTGFFGNMLLAWIPLILSIAVWKLISRGRTDWLLKLTLVCWFLFFPNAAYIITDLVHIN